MSLKRALIYLLAVSFGLACGHAGVQAPRPLVVELFTSQGCSSCPPADAFLGKLSGRSDVIALAFHVDYWDDLGWRDRFALAQCVERQDVYARSLNKPSVYTPQFVVDGKFDAVSLDARALDGALSRRRDDVAVSIAVRDAQLAVNLGAGRGIPKSDVLLVAYLRHAISAIGRGENAGRTLEEFNIVRAIRTIGGWDGAAESFLIPLASLPPDATDVAVLVQPPGQAPFVGAGAHALR